MTAHAPTALAQASQVYAPDASAPPQYAPTSYAPPAAPYPQAVQGDYGRPGVQEGYRPPAFNPAWVPQGYGTNQAMPTQVMPTQAMPSQVMPSQVRPNQAYGPPQRVAAYSEPPRFSGGRYADWSDSDYRYRLSAGDELALRFLLNPDLNTGVIVGPDGRGVFPLISSVQVADMTVEEANGVLSQAYSQILRRPDVQVLITAYGASQVYDGGEVRTPGVYPIRGQLTPAQAVMMAGGLATSARLGRVAIIRQRPNGQILVKQIDLKAYLSKGQGIGPFTILPGDLIFVPRSSIAEVDLFVDQYISGLLPLGRILGYRDNTIATF